MSYDKCGKCDGDITQPKEVLKCTDCGTVFHIACAKSALGDAARKVSTRTNYKCEGCISACTSAGGGRIRQGQDIAAVLDAIAALRKENAESFRVIRQENAEMWSGMQKKLDVVENNVKLVSTEVCDVKLQINSTDKKLTEAEDKVNKLGEKNYELSEEVKVLKSEINDLQQYSRVDNMIITGIPLSKDENVYNILSVIAKLLGLNFHKYDVSAAHRLFSQNKKGQHPAIVVKFSARSVKADWMHARKERRALSATEISKTFPDSKVYFNEHLTPYTRDIFNEGRQLVKDNKLAFVWVTDGRVLVKQTPTGRTIRVRDVAALRQLSIQRLAAGPGGIRSEMDPEAASPGTHTTDSSAPDHSARMTAR